MLGDFCFKKQIEKYRKNKIGSNEELTLDKVKEMLKERFTSVDYESAKEDVATFINDTDNLKLWKKELFISTLDELKAK